MPSPTKRKSDAFQSAPSTSSYVSSQQSSSPNVQSHTSSSTDDDVPASKPSSQPDDNPLKVQKLNNESSAVVRKLKPDSNIRKKNVSVVDDYSFKLGYTDIKRGVNNFIIGQVIEDSYGKYFVFTKTGTIGTNNPGYSTPFITRTLAISDFKSKFKKETGNDWEQTFKLRDGKHNMFAVETVEPDTKLNLATKNMVEIIFEEKNKDLMTIMPLGIITSPTLDEGFEVLKAIEDAVGKDHTKDRLNALSSRYFTLIPRSDAIRFSNEKQIAEEQIDKERERINVLRTKEVEEKEGDHINVLDRNYARLHCDIKLLDPADQDYLIISKCFTTTIEYDNVFLKNIWSVDREGEAESFKIHAKIKNRRLLWHGTKVTSVAGILSEGMQIRTRYPKQRAGKGIYFASECKKAIQFVFDDKNGTGFLILAEVALGKEHVITQLQEDQKFQIPDGYDCVIGRGRKEPDPKKDAKIVLDERRVPIAQGKPISASKKSEFESTEYVVYKASQVRIRYLIETYSKWEKKENK